MPALPSEVLKGPVRLSPSEMAEAVELLQILTDHKTHWSEYSLRVTASPGKVDLLHLLILCGIASIEAGWAEYSLTDT